MEQLGHFFFGFIGIGVMVGIAYCASKNRKAIDWKLVLKGLGLQFVLALLVLNSGPGKWFFKDLLHLPVLPGEWFFSFIGELVVKLLDFTNVGSKFVFGQLATGTFLAKEGEFPFVFATQVLPTIIFFSALISILYYLGVMQFVVKIFAVIMMKVFGTSGAETLSCSANIFVGQTEAPLLIKPFVETMTRSEILTVMTGGFATVAGGVMAAYVGMLRDSFPDIAGHLLTASVLSAPGAIIMSKIILPETEEPVTKGQLKADLPTVDSNVIEAAASGAGQGVQLVINVAAMLLAFIALIAMINAAIAWCGNLVGIKDASFQMILGFLLSPLAWVMGVPWKDCQTIGGLFGERAVLNEFVAYVSLSKLLNDPNVNLAPRSILIVTYSLCGFANFSSIGIQIGGIGGLAPSRKADIAQLGLMGVLAGTLANFTAATIAGMLVSEPKLKKSVPPTPPAVVTPAPDTATSPLPELSPDAGDSTSIDSSIPEVISDSPVSPDASPVDELIPLPDDGKPEGKTDNKHGWRNDFRIFSMRYIKIPILVHV